jgi:hypothetical protein
MSEVSEHAGWQKARPQQLPKPTYFPFFTALSLMFFFWGLVSLWLIAAVGFAGMCVSLGGWIKDLLAEDAETPERPPTESL